MTHMQPIPSPGALWGNDRGLPNPNGLLPSAASKKDFTTVATRHHGGPRSENLPSVINTRGIGASPDLPAGILAIRQLCIRSSWCAQARHPSLLASWTSNNVDGALARTMTRKVVAAANTKMRIAPGLPSFFLRGPPWCFAVSVVKPCLLASARTLRPPTHQHSDVKGRNERLCLGMLG